MIALPSGYWDLPLPQAVARTVLRKPVEANLAAFLLGARPALVRSSKIDLFLQKVCALVSRRKSTRRKSKRLWHSAVSILGVMAILGVPATTLAPPWTFLLRQRIPPSLFRYIEAKYLVTVLHDAPTGHRAALAARADQAFHKHRWTQAVHLYREATAKVDPNKTVRAGIFGLWPYEPDSTYLLTPLQRTKFAEAKGYAAKRKRTEGRRDRVRGGR